MKILFLNDFESGGGAENYVQRVMDALKAEGHKTKFISTIEDPNFSEQGLGAFKDKLFAPKKRRKLLELIETFDPDVIHVHNIHKGTLPILRALSALDTPVIKTMHDYRYYCVCPDAIHEGEPCRGIPERCLLDEEISLKNYIFRKPIDYLRKSKLGIFDKILAPSEDLANLSSRFVETEVLHNFVDTSKYVYNENKSREDILFVGKICEEKGLSFLLDIAEQLPDQEFKIVGKGEIRNYKDDAEEREMSNVRFSGYISEEELIESYQTAEIIIMPSKWRENAPLTLLESLASGTPALVTKIGGMRNYVDEETGYVVEYGDVESATGYIRSFLSSSLEEKNRIRESCRQTAINHSQEKHISRVVGKYEEILENN